MSHLHIRPACHLVIFCVIAFKERLDKIAPKNIVFVNNTM